MSTNRRTPAEQGPASPFWTVPALLVIAGGVLLGVFVYIGGRDEGPRSVLEPFAFGAPTLVAGLMALFGIRGGHPIVVLAAGIALLPLSFISVVLWPLFVPAALLIAFGAGRTRQAALHEVATGVLVAVGLPVALFAMLIHQDPMTWTSDDGNSGGGSSNVVTKVEAGLSLAITATVASAATVTVRRRH